MIITDTQKITKGWLDENYHIDDQYLIPDTAYRYSVLKDDGHFRMKPVGRVYFEPMEHLNYVGGGAVEHAWITSGEHGVIDRYLKPGVAVFTQKQVEEIVDGRLYDKSHNPKLPEEVYNFLKEIAAGKAKNKNQRAQRFLDEFKVIGDE